MSSMRSPLIILTGYKSRRRWCGSVRVSADDWKCPDGMGVVTFGFTAHLVTSKTPSTYDAQFSTSILRMDGVERIRQSAHGPALDRLFQARRCSRAPDFLNRHEHLV